MFEDELHDRITPAHPNSKALNDAEKIPVIREMMAEIITYSKERKKALLKLAKELVHGRESTVVGLRPEIQRQLDINSLYILRILVQANPEELHKLRREWQKQQESSSGEI